MKPSERILQLRDLIIDGRLKELEGRPGIDFLLKVSGTSTEDARASLARDPAILIAAVVMYLDETHGKR